MVRKSLHKIFNYFGYSVHGAKAFSNPYHQLSRALSRFEVDLVLDVGANKGQFASRLRKAGYEGKMVSFEPLSAVYPLLVEASEGDPLWEVHPRCAIGAEDGTTEINVAGNSLSSSILPIMESHISVSEESSYVGRESVREFRLDTAGKEYLQHSKNPVLKIDTQGYEWQVLDGTRESLPGLRGIRCELSLVPLYEGQVLFDDVMTRLRDEGFTLWSIQDEFTDPESGRTLQVDALFFRI